MNDHKTAIIGGSFNPPTFAHMKLIEMSKLTNYDRVIIAPVYQHPFGKDLIDIKHRINMLNIAIDLLGLPDSVNIEVVDVEKKMYGFHQNNFTVNLVNYYYSPEPDRNITLIVGSDSIEYLSKWHKYEELCEMVNFKVMPRNNSISSTSVRDLIKKNKNYKLWLGQAVPEEIIAYIEEHNLYR